MPAPVMTTIFLDFARKFATSCSLGPQAGVIVIVGILAVFRSDFVWLCVRKFLQRICIKPFNRVDSFAGKVQILTLSQLPSNMNAPERHKAHGVIKNDQTILRAVITSCLPTAVALYPKIRSVQTVQPFRHQNPRGPRPVKYSEIRRAKILFFESK
jgi:hypothetical protein